MIRMAMLIGTKEHLPWVDILLSKNYTLNFMEIISISSLFPPYKLLLHSWRVHSKLFKKSFEVAAFSACL